MRVLRLVGAVVIVAGCGGGGDGGGGTPPPPPTVASVVINPAAAQSITVGGTVSFSAQPQTAQGSPLSRTVSWTTSDQSKVSLSATTGTSVTATGVAAGTSQIRATSEGVQSTPVTVTVTAGGGPNPSTADVTATSPANTFSPATVTIAPGGTVTWTIVDTHNVTFSGNAPPGGSSPPALTNTTFARTFPNAGAYPYTCTLHQGMNGTVNVQ
jgi:plastocyanin